MKKIVFGLLLLPLSVQAINQVVDSAQEKQKKLDCDLFAGIENDDGGYATRECLRLGANPNAINEHGETPFLVAVRLVRLEDVRLLLDAGAKPFVRIINNDTSNNASSFIIAARGANEEMLNLLLAAHEDLDVDIDQDTLVKVAAQPPRQLGGKVEQALRAYIEARGMVKDNPVVALGKAIEPGFTGIVKVVLSRLILNEEQCSACYTVLKKQLARDKIQDALNPVIKEEHVKMARIFKNYGQVLKQVKAGNYIEALNKAVEYGFYGLVALLLGELTLTQAQLSSLGRIVKIKHETTRAAVYKEIGVLLYKHEKIARGFMSSESCWPLVPDSIAAIIARDAVSNSSI